MTPAPQQSSGVAGWQPIETAPRDDTLILVWRSTVYSDDPFVVVRWENDWWQVHDGKNDWNLRGPDPTHWMPLPEAPGTVPTDATLTAHAQALDDRSSAERLHKRGLLKTKDFNHICENIRAREAVTGEA